MEKNNAVGLMLKGRPKKGFLIKIKIYLWAWLHVKFPNIIKKSVQSLGYKCGQSAMSSMVLDN